MTGEAFAKIVKHRRRQVQEVFSEAFDMLDALNTGHAGSLSTLHANSCLQGLSRLASLALRANVEIPHNALRTEIGDLINLVVHIERHNFKRRVSEVIRLRGFD